MIVDFFTLEQIARGPRDRIGVSAAAARDEVGDAAVLVTFIVVHMSGEDHDARAQLLLLFFEISGEFLFRRACAVSATIGLVIGGTGVGRMMQHDEDEIYVGGNVFNLVP